MFEKSKRELEAIARKAETEAEALQQRIDELGATAARARAALAALEGTDMGPTVGAMSVDKHPPDHRGKYRPIFLHLRASSGQGPLRMTFTEVEEILGFPLPPSSRRHLPHWHSYEGSAVVRAIRDAGWSARRVNMDDETVEFVETEQEDKVRKVVTGMKVHDLGGVWVLTETYMDGSTADRPLDTKDDVAQNAVLRGFPLRDVVWKDGSARDLPGSYPPPLRTE